MRERERTWTREGGGGSEKDHSKLKTKNGRMEKRVAIGECEIESNELKKCRLRTM